MIAKKSRGPGVKPLEQRLLEKARPEGDCLLWFGDKDPGGYGRIRHAGRKVYSAHRLMYELHHGVIPLGLVVRHKCDNPGCIAINHLELGTHQDNSDDKMSRGRDMKLAGEAHGRAKLTQVQVDDIRRIYVPGKRGFGYKAIARRYGMALSSIRAILRGEHWKAKA